MTDSRRDVVVVGAGHNGLVAACYLARAGLDVEVVERDSVVGGAVSTVERWPGVHVDRGSTMHVMVRHTGIIDELDLAGVGLEYIDADPWAVSVHEDEALQFACDIDVTCASIESVCGARDADAYAAFAHEWQPRLDAMLRAFNNAPTPAGLARAFWPLGQRAGRGGGQLAREFLQSADTLLDATFRDERLKSALAWWAAQAGPPPHERATAPILATALLMHRIPPARPRGGSGALAAALVRRLNAFGGTARLGDGAAEVRRDGSQWEVQTASGTTIRTKAVVFACHIVTALELLGQRPRPRLRVGSGMGMVLRARTDRLPTYRASVGGMVGAMQFPEPSRGRIRSAYNDFVRGETPRDPPLLVLTPTATDDTLAPRGQHVVTIWTQWHPRRLRGSSWDDVRDRETTRLIDALDRYAPGFAPSVQETLLQTPADLESEIGLRGGNVMHLDMSLGAMFTMRPLPQWSRYRGPGRGIYLCGASTHPGGGVSGASGRSAANAVLDDLHRRPGRR